MIGGSPLNGENPPHRGFLARIGGKPVNGFGGYGD
jgi:hypothetical protein